MPRYRYWILLGALLLGATLITIQSATAREVERPEEIKSKREVVYDDATYVKLARLWKEYNDAYPSEFAYANWMYAARYAGDKNYAGLLEKGLEKYPDNPTLLYLKALVMKEDGKGRRYLERAIAIDPAFADPWFGLVIDYMHAGDQEQTDLALRRLLESGVISDEIMDYNYNVLIGLEPDAILITNGDNDTYPAWILTRVLNVRPDVTIVNRSMLNTDWYPLYLLEHGFPRFISKSQLDGLRSTIMQDMEKTNSALPPGGPFSDTLVLRAIDSADRAGRPVYFAKTVYLTDKLSEPAKRGRDLGLATLVTPSQTSYQEQMNRMWSTWIDSFRTAGLQSWRLRNAPQTSGSQFVLTGYAYGIAGSLDRIKEEAPDLRRPLFQWYISYVDGLLSEESRSKAANAWCCAASDVPEVDAWCRELGLKCEEGE